MRVRRGAVRLLDYHLERLDEGCRRLEIARPAEPRAAQANSSAARRCGSEGVLKLIVTRGIGPRGYRPSGRGALHARDFAASLAARSGAPAVDAERVRAMRDAARA